MRPPRCLARPPSRLIALRPGPRRPRRTAPCITRDPRIGIPAAPSPGPGRWVPVVTIREGVPLQNARPRRRALLLAACLAWVTLAPSALALDPSKDLTQYVQETWPDRDRSTRCVLRGRDGYLWLATNYGLVRFDGVR